MTDTCATCFFYAWHRPDLEVAQAVTITNGIATPAVLTTTSDANRAGQFALNDPIVLSTTGVLPLPLIPAIAYYVIPVNLNTFKLAASPNGAAINTTGAAQSGAHVFDFVVMGCHRTAPPTTELNSKSKWKPVDPDYWCGDFSSTAAPIPIGPPGPPGPAGPTAIIAKGSVLLAVAPFTDISVPSIIAGDVVVIAPTNSLAAVMMTTSKNPYISSITPSTGFRISIGDGTNGFGQSFNYAVLR